MDTVQAALLTPTSHGFSFGAQPVGELYDSTPLQSSADQLRVSLLDHGYLLLRGALDRELVLAARAELCAKLAKVGLLKESHPVLDAVYSGSNDGLARIDRTAFAKDLRSGPAITKLLHTGNVVSLFERLLSGKVLPFSYIWVRTVRPGAATGCHYDWVYMGRGTQRLYTAWTPLGDVPFSDGPLAVLEGSHQFEGLLSTYGKLDVDRDKDHNPYVGGWLTKDPGSVHSTYGGRWLTTEFQPGDVLIFGMFTLHCSLDNTNADQRIRLSTDSRYQLAEEPADERWTGEDPFGHGMM